jgi:aspartate-semialdehyde dehydrogenase
MSSGYCGTGWFREPRDFMSSVRDSQRIVIAGASSLLGAELKSLLEESRFAAADFRLLDEELAAGTLTEAGGEAAVIQPVEEDSFHRAQFIFFTGSPEFTRTNLPAAHQGDAKIIDLSGALAKQAGTTAWFPLLETLRDTPLSSDASVFTIPSAGAAAAAALSLALMSLGLRRLSIICFQPVSAAGRAGIEELESQTSQLLSFRPVGKPVFDAQVAFALLDCFGPASSQNLLTMREQMRDEIILCTAGKAALPAFQLLHAPVFYGVTFAACAEVEPPTNHPRIVEACKRAGFAAARDDEGLSNVSAAGESVVLLTSPHADPASVGTWWFWGAADNIRLPAWNAVMLADKLAG